MSPREAFGVIIRVAGVGFMFAGLFDLIHLALMWLGIPTASNYPQAAYAAGVIVYEVVGVITLLTANFITGLVYRRVEKP